MSRKIKFRAWSNEHNRYCDLIKMDEDDRWYGYIYSSAVYLCTKDIILEQYTGLTDKNGKEIYEGDLIKVSDAPALKDETLIVKFGEYHIDEYACTVMSGWLVQVVNSDWTASLLDEVGKCEVIGNIHENKELLGESD